MNAVTVAGCMHSFCEECLLKNLSISGICPTKGCKKNVDKNGYHRDSTLQMLVYKFMPRIFFENAEKDKGIIDTNDKKVQRELAQASAEICDPEELLSICLEFIPAPPIGKTEEDTVLLHPSTSTSSQNEPPIKKAKKSREQREVQQSFRRFFRCVAKVPIRTLRRLLETKLFLTDQFSVHFLSDRDFQDIPDDVTLRTLVLDGGFDRSRPFRLFFTLVPTISDDAPPVLDAETMPCLMPEAPVHQETLSSVQTPGQLQPVQIVSPVVPALTVSLSTDIYGHSAPIITTQCAPRKRRKLSDPKKSPTEKSPPNTSGPHPPSVTPNMLVGPLIRPMFITQPPFMHRSPPNANVSHMSFAQSPKVSTSNGNSLPRKSASPNQGDNVDHPPQLHREDSVSLNVPSSVTEESKSPTASSVCESQSDSTPSVQQALPPSLKVAQKDQSLPETLQPSPYTCNVEELDVNRPKNIQNITSSSKTPKSVVPKTIKSKCLSNSETTQKLNTKTVAKVINQQNNLERKPLSPYKSSVLKIPESPPHLEAMTSPSKSQASDKPPRGNSQMQNGIGNHAVSKIKPINSSAQPSPSEHLRPVQTVLPQIPNGDTNRMTPVIPTTPKTPPQHSVTVETKPEVVTTVANNLSTTERAASPTPAAPMDFRRMATLNKQSLGRTLQAVLTSGRAANADASRIVVNGSGTPADVKSVTLNGKISGETAVDLNYPKSKSLST